MSSPPSPILELRNVSINFGGLRAVDGATLSVPAGQVTSLIGPNGAGKTTIFNIICGLLPPATGDVRFQGRSLLGMPPHQVAMRGVGRTFQDPRVFKNMSVLDNVLLGMPNQVGERLGPALLWPPAMRQDLARRVEQARAILAEIGLLDRADELAGSLAYGQQRFLSLARVMAMDAPLLMMDEPSVGLHRGEILQLQQQIVRLVREQGRTVLLIEHNMDVVMTISDQIALLVQGKVVATGNPAEMQRNETLLVAYLGTTTTTRGAPSEESVRGA
jgi:ABC-type branched-subunit amino acid transport system ATPase component